MIDLLCVTLLAAWLAQSDAPAPEPGARDAAAGASDSGARRGDDPARAGRRARDRRLDPVVLRALAASDPPLDALRAAASALALVEPDRARSLVTRARFAGWLPEVRARVDRRFARSESVDLGSSSAAPLAPVGIDSNNDVRYELRATWDLSRMVFNPDELGAQFQALRTADARREIEALVIRLYFERRRLKAELSAADATAMAPAGMPMSGMTLELRVAEIEAELDALTGGAFTRLARRRDAEAAVTDQ
ncbi:MAG TPA: hypothetical protein VIF57_13850 [Polyangia bacterium]|jgi:hypothetical protein